MTVVTSPPTGLRAYRAVLAVPSLRKLMPVAFFVRIPATATAITLTLHVVLQMGLGYAAAGLVVAASTVGMGVGAPLMGRLVDRRDLRTMLAITLVTAGVFWAFAPGLGYPVLLGAAFVGGLWGVAGAALWLLDPAVRQEAGGASVGGLGLGLVAALVATFASVYLLIGTELVMVASLQSSGQATMIPVVNTVWCVASIAGGFAYGALRRPLPLAVLV